MLRRLIWWSGCRLGPRMMRAGGDLMRWGDGTRFVRSGTLALRAGGKLQRWGWAIADGAAGLYNPLWHSTPEELARIKRESGYDVGRRTRSGAGE